jgi:hypothetical protein
MVRRKAEGMRREEEVNERRVREYDMDRVKTKERIIDCRYKRELLEMMKIKVRLIQPSI